MKENKTGLERMREIEMNMGDVGRIETIKDGIVRIKGLANVKANEMLRIGGGIYCLAINIERESIGGLIFGRDRSVVAKQYVYRTGHVISIETGWAYLGRVVDALGNPIDGKGKIKQKQRFWRRSIERKAPGIIKRERIKEGLETGIKVIDSLVPIGRGQRELILGDRQTGKTSLGLDSILHQVLTFKKSIKDKILSKIDLVICIYVAIGQRLSTIARICDVLERKGCLAYTIVVSAPASSPIGFQYIAPYTGCTIAEYFSEVLDLDVLIIYDDLSKHAAVYRQMSLLLGRAPGREAYPGDVFYLHSRLLERAAKLKTYQHVYIEEGENQNYKLLTFKGGSITALPIVETVEGDVSAYIPTNVISITDGQIYLDVTYFSKGIRPAINPGLSVSRVGSAAQNKVLKSIAGSLKLELAQFREVEEFTRFGSSLDEATLRLLARGERLVALLVQPALNPMPVEFQILSIYAGVKGFLDNIPVDMIDFYEQLLHFCVKESGLFNVEPFLNLKNDLNEPILNNFLHCFNDYFINKYVK